MKMRVKGLFFIVLLFYMYLSSLSFQSHSDPLPSPSPASQSERQEEFCRTRSKLMQLWEELEIEPHQEFEQLVAKGDVNKFGLTVENMSRLNKFYAEVSDEQCLLLSYSITKSSLSLPPSSSSAGRRSCSPGGEGSPATSVYPLSLGETGSAAGREGCIHTAVHWPQTKDHLGCELKSL